MENYDSQLRKGTLEFCVLKIISKGEIYTSDIIQELKKADLLAVEGTIYPLLNRLKSASFLSYRWEESTGGPPRKYYELTTAGKKHLSALETAWKKLVKSINTLTKEQ